MKKKSIVVNKTSKGDRISLSLYLNIISAQYMHVETRRDCSFNNIKSLRYDRCSYISNFQFIDKDLPYIHVYKNKLWIKPTGGNIINRHRFRFVLISPRRVCVAEARTLLLIYWPIRDNIKIKMHGQGSLL